MSINAIIAKFEQEYADIRGKMDSLKERADFIASLLKELKGAAKPAPAGRTKRAAAAKKGKMTVRDGILKTVASAAEPITAGEIIKGAVALSGGKPASIRTQINTLAKAGLIAQVEHAGRGFKYRVV